MSHYFNYFRHEGIVDLLAIESLNILSSGTQAEYWRENTTKYFIYSCLICAKFLDKLNFFYTFEKFSTYMLAFSFFFDRNKLDSEPNHSLDLIVFLAVFSKIYSKFQK